MHHITRNDTCDTLFIGFLCGYVPDRYQSSVHDANTTSNDHLGNCRTKLLMTSRGIKKKKQPTPQHCPIAVKSTATALSWAVFFPSPPS